MKTKIIDILNQISRGETPPKKIMYDDEILAYNEEAKYEFEDSVRDLEDFYDLIDILNDEVEILETTITFKQDSIENNKQDKIEKFFFELNGSVLERINEDIFQLGIRVNEIIDRINKQ